MNKVERERQYFESKKQNDLFDLMSVTTVSGRESTIQPRNLSSSSKTKEISVKEALNEPESQVDHETDLSSGGATSLGGVRINNQAQPHVKEKALFDKSDSVSKSYLTPALSLPNDETSLNDEGTAIDTSPDLRTTHVPERLHDSPRLLKSEKEPKRKEVKNCGSSNPSAKKNKDHCHQSSPDHSIARKPTTTEQLVQFISTRVPRNKRVFCLIVRDKMSHSNKAKSYFYPTYYLFIQAIIDIDETGDQMFCQNNEEEYTINGDIVSRNVSNSADNSFSASSSISADMLFIGATNGNQQQMTGMKHSQGNSYSDNEECIDTETDDDYNTNEVKFYKKINDEKTLAVKSTTSLHGRDSPLVFPNLDNTSCSNPSNNDENCNVSERGNSTACLASKDVVDDKNSSIAQGRSSGRLRPEMETTNSSKTGRLPLKRNAACHSKRVVKRDAELSIEDSNEDGEDLDDDSDNDEFNLEPMMSGSNPKGKISEADECKIEQEIDYNYNQSLFDNDRNPYTGTNGVLLAGRKRKKAKT